MSKGNLLLLSAKIYKKRKKIKIQFNKKIMKIKHTEWGFKLSFYCISLFDQSYQTTILFWFCWPCVLPRRVQSRCRKRLRRRWWGSGETPLPPYPPTPARRSSEVEKSIIKLLWFIIYARKIPLFLEALWDLHKAFHWSLVNSSLLWEFWESVNYFLLIDSL